MYTSLNYSHSNLLAIKRFFSISTLFGIYFFVVFWIMIYGILVIFFGYSPEGGTFKPENTEE